MLSPASIEVRTMLTNMLNIFRHCVHWINVDHFEIKRVFFHFAGKAGEGLVELRRIETAELIAEDMAAARNVVYLPQGQSTLLALPQ